MLPRRLMYFVPSPHCTINNTLLQCFPQSKLDDYQAKKNKGERLNQDQLVREKNKTHFVSLHCVLEMQAESCITSSSKWMHSECPKYQPNISSPLPPVLLRMPCPSSRKLQITWNLLESCRRASWLWVKT